ncbi:Calx-beta domain-containing protein [Nocardioides humilatus]|nr:Calx-beta domain-containing protein [Nocardioides humilatus]
MNSSRSARARLASIAAMSFAVASLTLTTSPANGDVSDASLAPPPTYTIDDVTITEGDTGNQALLFVIARTGDLAAASSVTFETSEGSAAAKRDFTAWRPKAIKFKAGQASATVKVKIKGDKVPEYEEFFYAYLSAPVDSVLTDTYAQGTILNNDPGEPPVYTMGSAQLVEGDAGQTNMLFTIHRSGDLNFAGSVKYYTLGLFGHAEAGEDFVNKKPTKVSFPAGVADKVVKVAIKGDVEVEIDEYFHVALTDPVNGDLNFFPFGYGLILNDD